MAEEDGPQVHFPNGKSVPLSKLNKPHARIPGHTVPGKGETQESFDKRKAEELAQRASKSKEPEQFKDTSEKDPFEGMTADDIKIVFPNGKKVPWSLINKPHCVVPPARKNTQDDALGLLHTGNHRPGK